MKQITKGCLAIFCLAFFLIACGNKSSDKKKDDTNTSDTNQVATKPTVDTMQKGVWFTFKDMGVDSFDIPHTDVYLYVDGKETKIKSVNSCSDIPKDNYLQYEIPKEAVKACGGWWAGAGDYFYVVLRNGKPVVYAGWLDEGQEDKGYHWEELAMNK